MPAQPCLLLSPDAPRSNCSPLGTWLWGSMPVREGHFDETADLYSVSFIGAEVGIDVPHFTFQSQACSTLCSSDTPRAPTLRVPAVQQQQ